MPRTRHRRLPFTKESRSRWQAFQLLVDHAMPNPDLDWLGRVHAVDEEVVGRRKELMKRTVEFYVGVWRNFGKDGSGLHWKGFKSATIPRNLSREV